MADDVDILQERDELLMEALLKVRKPEGPAATGFCLSCDEPIAEVNRRWCDPDCRDDYDKRTSLNIR